MLVAWGEIISRCEKAAGETVAQNMKTIAIMARAPDEAKTVLRSAPRKVRIDIQQMSSCIFETVIGQGGVVSGPPSAGPGRGKGDVGVGAIPKGKGKGKD